ncbi:formate dehydrogenase accessory protein FdhE [Muribacter muris]|uniref:Protein FdhE homolog n=1 Tax=Muribacter muris TaxID=67855 RepID=A0A4Y9JWN9_9PAST|nr:formate dehydrogenase accessory protein FdhE [Muribacter muris]MBF0785686.1 formate dehydrogenase accessory protein FdhE [Muribacter muris]MBF0828357.1 formate dehydrogenase accessory protein FdhE [Muribacter muris]TFV08856.1 formate dehydrogenase accessory protein FdhE [Muribacter muris]
MSIRILPEDQIKQAASSFQHPPLLFANPKNLYARRAKRLRQLAENHPFGDYLQFAAHLVDVQLELLETHPIANISTQLTACLSGQQGLKPLDIKTFKRSNEWRTLLIALIEKFKPYANDSILATLEWLEKAAANELETLADHLLNERYEQVGADKAVFLWAALSLYWVQLTQQLPRHIQGENGERHRCPVCDSAPVASVIHFGDTQGLRYLHCALCESEWNMVRAKCSNCEQSGKLDYWSLDSVESPVKAESCGDCDSYLKAMYQEKDPYVEPIADDLATLFLDAEMEQKNLSRSGINPFLFQIAE